MSCGPGILRGKSLFLASLGGQVVALGMFHRWRCSMEGSSRALRVAERGEHSHVGLMT